jgi:hypothetical protein
MSQTGPDFIGIGAQKSGTTYAFEALRRCPGVSFPAMPGSRDFLSNAEADGVVLNTLPKEIQFLDGPNKGLSWAQYFDIFSETADGDVAGEISPAYMTAPIERIQELRDRCPDVKLFAIFRNPIERDWSAIRMIAGRREELDDEEALWKIANIRHVIEMGDYTGPLKRWLSIFPRSSFQFHTLAELEADPKAVVGSLLEHIGLDQSHLGNIPESKVFTGPSKECPARILELLRERHKASFDELAELTGLDVSDWNSAA